MYVAVLHIISYIMLWSSVGVPEKLWLKSYLLYPKVKPMGTSGAKKESGKNNMTKSQWYAEIKALLTWK